MRPWDGAWGGRAVVQIKKNRKEKGGVFQTYGENGARVEKRPASRQNKRQRKVLKKDPGRKKENDTLVARAKKKMDLKDLKKWPKKKKGGEKQKGKVPARGDHR